jgi:ATP-binding cassette subfamily F protein uup
VPSNSKISKAGKLSYKDQRELEQMPTQIAEAEQELATCHSKLADGSLYVADPSQAATIAARISTLDDLIISKLERWETLEAMQKGQ